MAKKQPVLKKLLDIRTWMNQQLIERAEEITGFLVALLAREHVLMVGPPGTAKSMLANFGCRSIDGAKFFAWLMTKHSVPEELFGQVSVKQLENDIYERVTTKKLPEATIAFLDEIWKSNSAILNALLTIINERKFINGTREISVPLKTVVAASNEWPEAEELTALFDRFALKYVVRYISDDNFIEFLNLKLNSKNGKVATCPLILDDELTEAQAEVDMVVFPQEILLKLKDLRIKLRADHNIILSERKWGQCLSLVQAYAYLNGHTEAELEDLLILKNAVWTTEKQMPDAMSVVYEMSNPAAKVALDFSNEIQSVMVNAVLSTQDGCTEAIEKIKAIGRRLIDAQQQYPTDDLKKLSDKVMQYKKQLSSSLVDALR